MPLYEYFCRKCSKRFEVLVFGSERPACPKCHGRDLERLFSTFAVAGAERKSESDSFGDLGDSDLGGGMDAGGDAGMGGDTDLGGDSGMGDDADFSGGTDPGGSDSWGAD